MPKLLVFAPCEKVIISQDENNPTLIAILSNIAGDIESPEPLEKNALGPMRWQIFTLWQKVPSDGLTIFEQRIRLVSPSGRTVFDAPQQLQLTAQAHRMTAALGTVPIGENGDWELQLFLHVKDTPIPDSPLATYPLQIKFRNVVATKGST